MTEDSTKTAEKIGTIHRRTFLVGLSLLVSFMSIGCTDDDTTDREDVQVEERGVGDMEEPVLIEEPGLEYEDDPEATELERSGPIEEQGEDYTSGPSLVEEPGVDYDIVDDNETTEDNNEFEENEEENGGY